MLHFRMVKAKDLMEKNIHGLDQDSTIEKAVAYIIKYKVDNVPVVDENNRLIGVLTKNDILENINYYKDF